MWLYFLSVKFMRSDKKGKVQQEAAFSHYKIERRDNVFLRHRKRQGGKEAAFIYIKCCRIESLCSMVAVSMCFAGEY